MVSGAMELWSLSTPIAQILASLQASITPSPVPPATWKITSAPLVTMLFAAVFPAAVSAKELALACKTLAFTLASKTPAV